jgi:hypothetical protein
LAEDFNLLFGTPLSLLAVRLDFEPNVDFIDSVVEESAGSSLALRGGFFSFIQKHISKKN